MSHSLFREPGQQKGVSSAWLMIPGLVFVALYFLDAFRIVAAESWLTATRLPLRPTHLFFLGLGLLVGGVAIAALRHALKPQAGPIARTTDRVKPVTGEDLREEEEREILKAKEQAAAAAAAPAPEPAPVVSEATVAAEDLEGHPVHQALSLEEEIKQLNRQISRANVKLGLGELSKEGYKQYTDKLRVKKAELESKLEQQKYNEQQVAGGDATPR